MNFDTAIFYDIENLIGGYGANMGDVHKLSLKKILASIKTLNHVGEIAVQRAYANWSDYRLSCLRTELIELGIEPIQMFGFGRGSHKNASDIHLAIDVIECALTKSFLQRFVIVSGDGGFATLAKKLHEHNRLVIGCAYQQSTNQVFESVCDEFLWLPHPSVQERKGGDQGSQLPTSKNVDSTANQPPKISENLHSSTEPKANPKDTKVEQSGGQTSWQTKYRKAIDQKKLLHEKNMLSRAKIAFETLINLKEIKGLMSGNGFGIGTISQALTLAVPDFSVYGCGFLRLADLVSHLVHSHPVELLTLPPSDFRLVVKGRKLEQFQKVESLAEPPEMHSAEFYLKLLSKGVPSLRLPAVGTLQKALRKMELAELSQITLPREELLRRVMDLTGGSEQDVKSIMITLVSLGFVQRVASIESPEVQLQTLSMESSQVIFKKIQGAVKEKLVRHLGRYDKCIVHHLFHPKPDSGKPEQEDTVKMESSCEVSSESQVLAEV